MSLFWQDFQKFNHKKAAANFFIKYSIYSNFLIVYLTIIQSLPKQSFTSKKGPINSTLVYCKNLIIQNVNITNKKYEGQLFFFNFSHIFVKEVSYVPAQVRAKSLESNILSIKQMYDMQQKNFIIQPIVSTNQCNHHQLLP